MIRILPILIKTLIFVLFLLLIQHKVYANTGKGNYQVEIYGKPAGTAKLSYSLPNNNSQRYQATLSYTPSSLANFLGGEAHDQVVLGNVNGGIFQPQTFQLDYANSDKLTGYQFSNNTVTYIKEDKDEITLDITEPVYDTLSLLLQLREDSKNNQLKATYLLITKDDIRGYTATEEINSETQNIHITLQQTNSGKRILNFVFNRHYNLLHLDKIKAGRSQFAINLVKE